jgi:hypothetical protein
MRKPQEKNERPAQCSGLEQERHYRVTLEEDSVIFDADDYQVID